MEPCVLVAGPYSSAPFQPAFVVTVPAGTKNDRAWAHGGELMIPPSAFFAWGTGFIGGTGPNGKAAPAPKTSADLVAYMRSFKGFTVTNPVPVTIDGKSGTTIDVTTHAVAAPSFLRIPEDAYNLSDGEKVRFFLFDMDGKLVMLMEETTDAPSFDREIETMKPMLDSLRWQ